MTKNRWSNDKISKFLEMYVKPQRNMIFYGIRWKTFDAILDIYLFQVILKAATE